MKSLTIFGIIACVGLLLAPTASIGKGETTHYQFAGYSSTSTTGNAGGFFGMHDICQADFGEVARMCTTEEFWKSPNAEPPTTDRAWIQPTIVAAYVFTNDVFTTKHIDFTTEGIDYIGGSIGECNHWISDNIGAYGITVTSNQPRISYNTCDIERRVTCCTPTK